MSKTKTIRREIVSESTANAHEKMLIVPLFNKFRAQVRREFAADSAANWIPVECSLLIRYEFAACSLPTRYIFVAILLLCGLRGSDKIPANTRYLANALAADERAVKKALAELIRANLLSEIERFEREEMKDTQTQKEQSGVSVDFINSFEEKTENENGLLKTVQATGSNGNSKRSQFTIEECLRYVEHCQSKGDEIKNAKALATNLFKSGEADSFILATLYPERLAEVEREQFGEPIGFTDSPCRVCFGAKMADADGKGFRKCEHCRDERGKSTGFEPKGETDDETAR
ncbi:MAG: hypothetical protein ACR2HT_04200 [Pyrinomonadaceae bacterium]